MKKILHNRKILFTIILFLSVFTLIFWFRHTHYSERRNCEETGAELGAGIYQFSGVEYEVKVCNTSIPGFADNTWVVAMMVYKKGSDELLAERLFDYYPTGRTAPGSDSMVWRVNEIDIENSKRISPILGERPLEVADMEKLYYGHTDRPGVEEASLSMPPGWIDWVRARIP